MKPYTVSDHAIKRAVERLGVPKFSAANHLIQLMQSAAYQGETGSRYGVTKVYCHFKTRTHLVVGEDGTIITVYRGQELPKPIPTAFIDDIKKLVERQLRKAQREYNSQYRASEIQVAELNVELAQLQLSQLKARSPRAKKSITVKINAIKTQIDDIKRSMEEMTESFLSIETEAETYLAGE